MVVIGVEESLLELESKREGWFAHCRISVRVRLLRGVERGAACRSHSVVLAFRGNGQGVVIGVVGMFFAACCIGD